MDPFSLTVGCISLISAIASVSRSVTNFVLSCRDARQDLAAVSRELSELDMTLHILKADTEAKGPHQLPNDLRRHVRDIMENCSNILSDFEELLRRYEGRGLDRAARWALSGRKDAEKMRSSLAAHKGALSLVVEAMTL
jgi:hypothetical protein